MIREQSIGMPLPKKCLFGDVVSDLDLSTHDLENAISVVWTWRGIIMTRFIKIRLCIPEVSEKMPPKRLI